MIRVFTALTIGLIATNSFAEENALSRPPVKFAKRDLAYASYVLGTEGADPTEWHAITVSPNVHCPTGVESNDDNCYHDVLYTTRYRRINCEDGRSYVARSGFGISLQSPTAGVKFMWAEHYSCEPCDHMELNDTANPERALDLSRVKIED